MFSEIFLFSTACPGCVMKFLGYLGSALALGAGAAYMIWGKYKGMVEGKDREIESLKARYNDKETEFASMKYAHDELAKDNSAMRATLSGCEGDKAALQAALDRCKAEAALAMGAAVGAAGVAASSPAPEADIAAGTAGDIVDYSGYGAYGRYFANDNLQVIEGIGPKISKTLTAAGITTWGQLSKKSESELRTVLDDAGISTKINDPKTWPEQARLANEGEWEELVKYQKFLDTGSERKGDFDTPAKVEKLYLKAIGFAGAKSDDLKVVEGIGPKIEGLLKDAGINDWEALSACPVSDIQKILDAAGDRYKLARPNTWPQQAKLAHEGQWEELKKLQDELSGGV